MGLAFSLGAKLGGSLTTTSQRSPFFFALSSHVDAERFASTLDDASLGCDTLRLLALHGAPCDHPMLPAFPEGRYLKFAVLG